MSDWTQPKPWHDTRKLNGTVARLQKRAQSTSAADQAEDGSLTDIAEVLAGHQANLVDANQVLGKLATYTTAAHEERRQELDTLAQLVKAFKQISKDVAKLTQRIQKLEQKTAPRKK